MEKMRVKPNLINAGASLLGDFDFFPIFSYEYTIYQTENLFCRVNITSVQYIQVHLSARGRRSPLSRKRLEKRVYVSFVLPAYTYMLCLYRYNFA